MTVGQKGKKRELSLKSGWNGCGHRKASPRDKIEIPRLASHPLLRGQTSNTPPPLGRTGWIRRWLPLSKQFRAPRESFPH